MNKYKIDILPNKVRLVTIPIKNAPTATVLVMIKTGSKYENRLNNGISHFLEHLFFKGTAKRPTPVALAGELDSLGGEYNAFTAKEYTGYWIKVAATKVKSALDLVGDMLLNSKFDPAEIEKERGVIIEELNMYEDNPLMHVEDVFEACLYGDTPAGWETIGTKENIRRFTREDFIRYLKAQYGAKSVYVILAGGIKEADKKDARKMFQSFSANNWQNKLPVKERQTAPRSRVITKKIDQVNLSLGVRACPIDHPEEMKVKLLSVILGGSMSSRLFDSLRGQSGLAYSVHTMTEFYSDSGYLTTQAGVPIKRAAEAVKIILAEYRRIAKELVSAKELKRAKDMLRGKLFLQLEASDNLATWYSRQAILRKNILTPAEFLRRLEKITANDLQKTAQKIFVNRGLNLALIGVVKEKEFKKILKF
jgi:predicted Zn-dependent peptidase